MAVRLDDVAAMALELPEATESESRGKRTWNVGGKMFAWERPLTKADIKRLGDEPAPEGEIVAVRVEDLHEKEAVLAEGIPGFFTISHFDGYPSVLIQLKIVHKRALRNALVDAWLAVAPDAVAAAFLASKRRR